MEQRPKTYSDTNLIQLNYNSSIKEDEIVDQVLNILQVSLRPC